MDRPRNNQFLEPERGPGMVGWAVKQLAFWLVGGLIFYSVAVNHHLFGLQGHEAAPVPADMRPMAASRDTRRVVDESASLVTNSLTLRAQANGHVVLDAEVNGNPIRFIVDTGATLVSLTRQDAERAGVAGLLNYSVSTITANGVAKNAPVTLRRLRIGQLEIDNVDGMVMSEETGVSLLGQSFLKRLRSYQMHNGVLTLTW